MGSDTVLGKMPARGAAAAATAANAEPGNPAGNVFEALVEAALAGSTHGEMCPRLRRELGFGQPLVVA